MGTIDKTQDFHRHRVSSSISTRELLLNMSNINLRILKYRRHSVAYIFLLIHISCFEFNNHDIYLAPALPLQECVYIYIVIYIL